VSNITVEYRGQLVSATELRSFGFMRRVKIVDIHNKYHLAWIPRWKVYDTLTHS
jgi:hypothetical protein